MTATPDPAMAVESSVHKERGRARAGDVIAGSVGAMILALASYFLVMLPAAGVTLVVAGMFGSSPWLVGSEMNPVGLPIVWVSFYVPPAVAFFVVGQFALRGVARSAGRPNRRVAWIPALVFVAVQVGLCFWAPLLSPVSFLWGQGIATTF